MKIILQNLPNRTYTAIRSRCATKGWAGRHEAGFKSGYAPLPTKSKEILKEESERLGIKGHRDWSQSEVQYLKDNYHKMRVKELQKVLLGRSCPAIVSKAMKMGCKKHIPDWTAEELKILREHYPKSNMEQMLKLLPERNWTAIKNRAQKLKIRQNHSYAYGKYKVNVDFFKTWSHDMAYVLGFIFADGHIRIYKRNVGAMSRSFGITQKDPVILERIKKAMSFNGIIREAKSTIRGKETTVNNLLVCNTEMVKDLIRHGVQYRKSLIMQFPKDIPDEFLGDWLRGYFDGDGCVRHLSKWHLDMTFTSGSKQFLIDLGDCLHLKWGTNIREIKHPNKDPRVNAYVLRYNKTDQKKIYNNMYHNNMGDLYLERKKKIFDEKFNKEETQ